jgi:hypothetical protein
MIPQIKIKSNIEEFTKELERDMLSQVQFATSLTVNTLAKGVVQAEKDEIEKDFPTATPFTRNAISFIPSTKTKLFATVFVKDIQERYLEPYTDGGMSIPAGPSNIAMLTPKGIQLNSYGNIPFGKIQSLKGGGNVFTGTIKTKSGNKIGGVFERLHGIKGGQRLKILVRFSDPHPVKEIFEFEQRATEYVEKNVEDVWQQSILRALATMK